MRNQNKLRPLAAACSIALLALGGAASAQTTTNHAIPNAMNGTTANAPAVNHSLKGDARDESRGAADDVKQATGVIRKMENEGATRLLHQAKGVFIVPKYGRAALGVGGRGGVGLLMVKQGDTWSDPAFYNFGGVSAGLEAGIEGGSFVLVLNNEKAVRSFEQSNNWSLNAGAGLTIVNWSAKGQASAGKGDVTIWSDVKGLFAGAQISLTDIKYDADQTSAYYGKKVAAQDVIGNKVNSAQADGLKQVLASAGNNSTTSAAEASTSTNSAAMSPAGAYPNGSSSMAGDNGAMRNQTPNRTASPSYENNANK